LIVSQVLTLFTTPVVYLFFDRVSRMRLNAKAFARPGRVVLDPELQTLAGE
jgi:hypothetical protein